MIKNIKKWGYMAGAAALAALCITGCGSSTSAESGNSESNTVKEAASQASDPNAITLRFAWWGGESRHNATLKAIEKYEELHPDIKIEPEYGGFDGYQQKLITQLSGQSAADIVTVDQPWLPDINKQGDLLMDLGSMKEIDTTQFSENLLKNCLEFDGKILGIPAGVNTNVLLYNKTVFDEKGIDVSGKTTWDDITSLGAKLHEEDPNFYLLNVEQTNINLMLQSFLQQKTGQYIFDNDYKRTFTEEQLLEGFNMVVDWLDKGVIEPVESSNIYLNRWYENPKWVDGSLGMCQLWLSSASTLTVDGTIQVGVAPMIRGNDEKGTGIMVRPSMIYSIPTSCAHPKEAAEFINWLLNDPEAVKIQGDVRGVPASEIAREILLEEGVLAEDSSKVINNAMEEGAMAIPNLPTGEMEQLWLDVIQEVEYKTVTPEEGAKKLIEDFDALLEDLKNKQ